MKTKEELAQIRREAGKKGGRPKGKRSAKVLERERVLEGLRQRTLRVVDHLFNTQLTLAKGCTYLYRIDKEWVATGGKNKGYWRSLKPVLVTSQSEIEDYLEGLIEEGDAQDQNDAGAAYYFLTTDKPNGAVVESMFNRTFGTPVQSTKIVDDDGKSIPIATLKIESL